MRHSRVDYGERTDKWSFTRDQNAKGHYKNSETGYRRATTAGSRVTGSRASLLACDDPNDAAEAYSSAARDAVINWWDNAYANRLADLRTGCRVLIQQRLHEEDLTGHILATDAEEWEVLVIREEFEFPQPKDPDFLPTSLGWTDPRKVEGELFFPERFPADVVEGERRRLGSAGYAGQHQQRPAPAEGQIFKKGHVRTFCMADTLAKLAECDPKGQPVWKYKRIILSADTAFKEKEENDYSVCLAVGERAEGYDLLDRWKDKARGAGWAMPRPVRIQWRNWRPSDEKFEESPECEPPKPSEPTFEGFEGSTSGQVQNFSNAGQTA